MALHNVFGVVVEFLARKEKKNNRINNKMQSNSWSNETFEYRALFTLYTCFSQLFFFLFFASKSDFRSIVYISGFMLHSVLNFSLTVDFRRLFGLFDDFFLYEFSLHLNGNNFRFDIFLSQQFLQFCWIFIWFLFKKKKPKFIWVAQYQKRIRSNSINAK